MYSCVQILSTQTCDSTSISADPDFDTGSFRLTCESPCLNTGSGAQADTFNLWQRATTCGYAPDLDLESRVIDVTDMGCYELQMTESCLYDIAPAPCRDGAVGVPDLLKIIQKWGSCPAGCEFCLGDFNDDDNVGVADLLEILEAWGECGSPGDGAPESVEDCHQNCASEYGFGTAEYADCMDKCIRALCEMELLPPEECP